MEERTATPRQGGSTAGKPSTSARYANFNSDQLDAGVQWLKSQGADAWSKRLWIDGDYIKGDLRGVPPVVRQMVREQLAAIQLMTAEQYADYWERDVPGRVALVDQVLTEAGR
jgi:hypothetical protein